jgi:pyruvate dehydrogenase kinase 2/3/4
MNQHTELFEANVIKSPRQIGIIDTACRVESILENAYYNASILCERQYTVTPGLNLTIHNNIDPKKPNRKTTVSIVYPPNHLNHIIFELVKNAMRATLENKTTISVPDIEVLVAKGDTDVSIKISDQVGNNNCLLKWTYCEIPTNFW